MTTQLTSLLNPRWANAEQTMIDCEITINLFGDEILPFTASQNDIEAHGRGIFQDIVNGVYGPIAEYIQSPLQSTSALEADQPVVHGAQTL